MDHTASLASVDHDDLRVSTHLSLRGAMERGQMPSELDVEMLRGENYGKGGKKVWPPKFAAWAARFSKKRAGDAPASVETDGGGASATAAARAAVAELLRAVAVWCDDTVRSRSRAPSFEKHDTGVAFLDAIFRLEADGAWLIAIHR